MTFKEDKDSYNFSKENNIHDCYSCMNFWKEYQLCCWELDDPEKVENPESPFCWYWNKEPWYG